MLEVASRIDRVVVHPGAAMVTRIASATLTASGEVAFVGLPASLDEDSLEVEVSGPARATGVRSTLAVVTTDAGGSDADRRAAATRLAELTAERASLKASLAALAGLAPVAAAGDRASRPRWSDVVTAREGVLGAASRRAAALKAALAELERAIEAAQRALAAAEERWRRRSSAELAAGSLSRTVVASVQVEGDGGPCTLACRYRVAGARWAPRYVARLGDGQVRLEVRAAVAQATGEDWRDARLELSTAAPTRKVALPELPALRIGRAQPAPQRAGWRAPPVGVDELYRDWDAAFRDGVPPAPRLGAEIFDDLEADEPTSEQNLDALRAIAGAPPPAPMAEAAMAPPMPAPMMASRAPMAPGAAPPAPMKKTMMMASAPAAQDARRSRGKGEGGGGRRQAAAPPLEEAAAITAAEDLLAFGALYLPGPEAAGRGVLRRHDDAARGVIAADVLSHSRGSAKARRQALSARPLPAGCHEPGPGQYDYAFATGGRVDVAADGAWHAIAVASHAAPVTIAHVVSPAVAPEVYRLATVVNPLDAPLLAGPVDVYERDELVLTAPLDETPPGGAIQIGLGVDLNVKVARNLRYREESAGVLRGSLRLIHEVTIDVEHLGGPAAALEVRERVPIPAPDTDEVEVTIDEVVPAWEPWRPEPAAGVAALRGGHRWRLALAPGERRSLRVAYAIKIASKHELVGGNRRDA